MKILGIDPGTAIVGWGIIEPKNGTAQPIRFGHISTSKTLSPEKRLVEIQNDLETILKEFHPKEAAVEDLFFFNNQKTAISVAQARGVILLTLERFGVKIYNYTPLQVKQALTNYGRAEKVQVQMMVKSVLRLSVIPKPDDVADALAIAICHMNRRTMERIQKS